MPDDAEPGTETAGPAGMWTRALTGAHERLRPALAQDRHEHVVGLAERLESELAPLVGPVIDELLDSDAVPESLRPLLAELAGPTHFSTALLLGFAVGAALSPIVGASLAPAVQKISNLAWSSDPALPLPPATVAVAQVRGLLGTIDPESEAEKSGVNAHRLGVLADNAGETLPIGQLLVLWRRGKLSDAQLARGLRQARLREEWFDAAEQSTLVIMTPEEALEGWLEGQLDEATALAYYTAAGGDPAQFVDRYNIRGQAPTPTQALELLNRGVIAETGSGPTSTSYEQAFLEGPWRNKWLGPFLALRRYVPPVRSIVPMLRNGAITEDYARELLAMNGVQGTDIDAYIHEATTGRQAAVRELTTAQVTGLYEIRMIDRGDAAGRLAAVGWAPDDAALLIDQADERRTQRFVGALVTKVANLYVGWKIDKPAAVGDLNQAGVPPEAQADLFRVWDIERASNVHHPTLTQVLGAWRRDELNDAETKARLLAMGVQPGDIRIVAADAFPPTKVDHDAVTRLVGA